MAKYDDASWHYSGDFPEDLTNRHAGIHIAFYLHWCIEKGFISSELKSQQSDALDRLAAQKITALDFLFAHCDEKLLSEDLNAVGNAFTAAYYEDNTPFAEEFSSYFYDYFDLFDELSMEQKGEDLISVYHVENNLENYAQIKQVLDARLNQWYNFNQQ